MKPLVLILTTTFLLYIAGCGANVRTYTFKVDRPDQELVGNMGYISGETPQVESVRKSKRTIVGIDIELPTPKEFIEETGLKLPGKTE